MSSRLASVTLLPATTSPKTQNVGLCPPASRAGYAQGVSVSGELIGSARRGGVAAATLDALVGELFTANVDVESPLTPHPARSRLKLKTNTKRQRCCTMTTRPENNATNRR